MATHCCRLQDVSIPVKHASHTLPQCEQSCQMRRLHADVFGENFWASLLIPAWTLLIPLNYLLPDSRAGRVVETGRRLRLDSRHLALPGSPGYDLLFQEHQCSFVLDTNMAGGRSHHAAGKLRPGAPQSPRIVFKTSTSTPAPALQT